MTLVGWGTGVRKAHATFVTDVLNATARRMRSTTWNNTTSSCEKRQPRKSTDPAATTRAHILLIGADQQKQDCVSISR